MPLYEYQCDGCGKRFEVIRKFSDPPLETCTQCGAGPVTRLLSSPAIQFKGSGWYITDYSDKGKSGAASEKPKKDEAATSASDSSEKKPSSSDTAATPKKSDSPAPKATGSA